MELSQPLKQARPRSGRHASTDKVDQIKAPSREEPWLYSIRGVSHYVHVVSTTDSSIVNHRFNTIETAFCQLSGQLAAEREPNLRTQYPLGSQRFDRYWFASRLSPTPLHKTSANSKRGTEGKGSRFTVRSVVRSIIVWKFFGNKPCPLLAAIAAAVCHYTAQHQRRWLFCFVRTRRPCAGEIRNFSGELI
jgi:hypothetical protein